MRVGGLGRGLKIGSEWIWEEVVRKVGDRLKSGEGLISRDIRPGGWKTSKLIFEFADFFFQKLYEVT